MHYNLLNFGNTTGYCNTSNNNIDDKENWLKDIISYVQPEILTVNEIGANTYVHQRLLDSSLNVNGINYYKKAVYTNIAGSSIVNMLYYDSTKIVLHSQDVVQPVTTRDIHIYKLYHRSPNLSVTHDTVFFYCIVAHLKAGNSSADAAKRAVMTNDMMNYLSANYPQDNFLFLGDYNVYRSSEAAYQNLIDFPVSDYNFYDPINRMGSWNNNSSYADVHTQSTHSSSNGCASGGGMDDRFDQILVSDMIMKGSEKVEYVTNTYTAVGQDGLHFNKSINASPVNTSVPPDVLNALYNMSDHLPVTMDLKITPGTTSINDRSFNDIQINFKNPVDDIIDIKFKSSHVDPAILELYSGLGQQLKTATLNPGENQISFRVADYPTGMYLLIVRDSSGNFYSEKFLKL